MKNNQRALAERVSSQKWSTPAVQHVIQKYPAKIHWTMKKPFLP
jgi:hypothetical protein